MGICRGLRSLPLCALFPLVAAAQSGVVMERAADAPAPKAKAEPRKRIYADPAAIASKLLSGSEEVRPTGFRQLGIVLQFPNGGVPELEEVRLVAVNLDGDSDLERALIFSFGHSGAISGLVFDFDGKVWWQVGEFGHTGINGGLELVELKGATSSSTNDVIVRSSGSGTGIVSTELTIYRMWAGRLYRVFRTVEREDYDTGGPNKVGERHVERRQVIFPVEDESRGSVLIVHHTAAVDPQPDAPCQPRSMSCSVYRWDQRGFQFVRDRNADAAHCDVKSRQPRARAVTACGQ